MKIPRNVKNVSQIWVFPIILWIGLIGLLWGGMHLIGSSMPAKVTHHETAEAHCYTAGKMFFVSIACVPK